MSDLLAATIQRPRHIPSLDGLRALSIALVVILHTLQHRSLTHPVPFVFYVLGNGSLGVFIFFVISGYLITSLLLREQEKTGRISLSSFYIRRGFRILPPLYTYILFVAMVCGILHVAGLNRLGLVEALTFTQNYVPGSHFWAFEHFWSLCIEEQFYLLWPSVVVFCVVRRSGVAGRKAAACAALTVILLEPFLRVASFRYLPGFHNMTMFHLDADGLMYGSLGPLLQGRERFEGIYRRATRWPWLLPVLLFLVSGALGMKYENYWNLPLGITINGFLVLMWLLWLVRNPQTLTGRLFNQPVIAWIGRLSYSFYIWQTFFLHHDAAAFFGHAGYANTFPGAWVCILGAGSISFYCIEQPALRLRDAVMRKIHWREI